MDSQRIKGGPISNQSHRKCNILIVDHSTKSAYIHWQDVRVQKNDVVLKNHDFFVLKTYFGYNVVGAERKCIHTSLI